MYVISSDSPLLVDDETYLAHYGIKGQKWGIRRTPEQLRRARGTKPWEGKNTPPGGDKDYASRSPSLARYSKVLGATGGVIDTGRYLTNRRLDAKNGSRRDADEGKRIRRDVDASLTSRARYLDSANKAYKRGDYKKGQKFEKQAEEIGRDLLDHYKSDPGVVDFINREWNRYGEAYTNETAVERGTEFLTYIGPRTGNTYVNFPTAKRKRTK